MITVLYCTRIEKVGSHYLPIGPWKELLFCAIGSREGITSGGSFAVYPGPMRYRSDRDGG